jgi:hypothetical protein
MYLGKEECDKANCELPDSIREKYLKACFLGAGGFGEVSLVFEKVKHEAEICHFNLKFVLVLSSETEYWDIFL